MSDRDLHERASALFLELRPLSDEQRQARLAAADEPLRLEVRSLLEHDQRDSPTADGLSSPVAPNGPVVPRQIGPYQVVQRIGQGGSGIVFLAEQREPVRRRVAIKVVPYAAISQDLAARFEFERRALERTDHPSIARILDAGRTGDGLPYLVMDYVEGEAITEYCRAKGLDLSRRIELLLEVADAVQHAHQRGVIHRDLKPGNILVTDASGRPLPRMLDFGIAKPTPEAYDELSPPTSGMPMGTPAYMAPEQTGGQPIDTRADVYALGAVLYELVCGRPPIDAKGDALEVLRRVRESIPVPASRVLYEHAQDGDDAPPTWLLTDLDCIIGKALEKEPARRYSTVAAFMEDLRRLLRREPIAARPPTVRYRVGRFALRNRALAAGLALAALAVIVGIAGLTGGLIEANRQRREAANQSESQREINKFLTDDLLAGASPDQEGQNVSASDLLDRAASRVDRRFSHRPLVAASIHHTLGAAYTQLGAYDKAETHLNKAIELRRAHAGPDAPDTIHSEIAAASLLGTRQKYPEADAALVRVIQRARMKLGPDDPALYAAINDLGVVRESMDKGQEAVDLLKTALDGRVRLLGERDPQVLVTTSNLAQAYDRVGKPEESIRVMKEALRIADSLEEQPRLIVLGLCNNIGATYQDLNREKEAQPYLQRAADLAAGFLGPEDPATLSIQVNLAGLEAKLGDPVKAADLYDRVVKARTKIMGPDTMDTLVARYGYWDALRLAKRTDEAITGLKSLLPDMARVMGEQHWLTIQTRSILARTLYEGGHNAEALPLARQAADEFLKLYGPDHARTRNARELAGLVEAALGTPPPD